MTDEAFEEPPHIGHGILCYDCRAAAPRYRVHDETWLAALPHHVKWKRLLASLYPEGRYPAACSSINMCFPCLERRLGRPLRPADFDLGLPVNLGIAWGLKQGALHATP